MTRVRRKKSEMPFADALEAADKRLKRAQKEKDEAVEKLTALDSEIPALQRTIQALREQLGSSKIGQPPSLPKFTDPQREAKIAAVAAEELDEDQLLPEPEGTPLVED